MTATRRLAAILAADVAGYSRLMGVDEEGTLERLKGSVYDVMWAIVKLPYSHFIIREVARRCVSTLRRALAADPLQVQRSVIND